MRMKCAAFDRHHCRSCSLLDQPYEKTIQTKEADLRAQFATFPSLPPLRPTVKLGSDAAASRNKAKFAVFKKEQEICFGFFDSSGNPHPLEDCPLHLEGIHRLLPSIKRLLGKYELLPYNLASRRGELKYLLISESDSHGEILLRFVLRSRAPLAALGKVCDELLALHPQIRVITANIQPIHQAILEGDEEILLTPNAMIRHRFENITLLLGPRSFFQVTPEIARALYRAVGEQIAIDQPRSLLDLYCGVGAFSFYAAATCSRIRGIEISKEAIQCAQESKTLNQMEHLEFEALDVAKYLESTCDQFEGVLVNPPRRGLNPQIIESLIQLNARFIYYSSCNSKTLARDFQVLSSRYEMKSLQLFDMFPYTPHYETLACLIRKE